MSSQTTLTEDAPMILDATCSYARIWPRHASLRMDVRKEVHPDIVGSACALPFRDGAFDAIFCDPPHMILGPGQGIREARRRSGRVSLDMFSRYGWFGRYEDWLSFVAESGPEFRRTLKTTGRLFYKMTSYQENKRPRRGDLDPMPFDVVKEKITTSQSNLSHHNSVHWLTMKPKPQEGGR